MQTCFLKFIIPDVDIRTYNTYMRSQQKIQLCILTQENHDKHQKTTLFFRINTKLVNYQLEQQLEQPLPIITWGRISW